MFQVNPLLGRIHLKHQALFSLKDKSKKLNVKCRLLQFLCGTLRVKTPDANIFFVKNGQKFSLRNSAL